MRMLKNPRLSTVSLLLGIASLIVWIIPTIGVPVALIGLLIGLGGKGERGDRGDSQVRRWAIAVNITGLVLTIIHGVFGSIVRN